MDAESLLLTHAEVAVAVAGFATVAAVLQRPLGPIRRNRFYTILLSSLQEILGCLVPVWLSNVDFAGGALWRTASMSYLGFSVLLTAFLIQPTLKLGRQAGVVINAGVTVLIYSLAATSFGCQLVNLFAIPVSGFGWYYASLLAGLIVIFIVFAEVATEEDQGHT